MTLDRNSILAANDIQIERVPVPSWGGEVCIRVISGADRDRVDSFIKSRMGKDNALKDTAGIRVFVVTLAACTETGARLFTDEDAKALAEKSSVELDAIYTAASKLNRLGGEGADEAREDFLSGQSGASGTG